MKARIVLSALVLVAASAGSAHALGPLDVLVGQATREARLDTGLQTGVVGWLGYGQRLPRLELVGEHDLAYEVRVGMPLISPDFGDSALEGGLQLDVWGVGRWRLRNQLDLGVRSVQTTVFDAVELAVRDTLSFGWQGASGGFGLDLGWEQGLTTHIHHGDWYRTEVYPDAEDGWIAFPSGRVRMGLYGGLGIGKQVYAALRLGLDWDRTGRPDYVPIVAVLTAAWRF